MNDQVETEPAKAASAHAGRAAAAMRHEGEECSADLDGTAAINAGFVLAEVWLFVSRDAEEALKRVIPELG